MKQFLRQDIGSLLFNAITDFHAGGAAGNNWYYQYPLKKYNQLDTLKTSR